MGRHVASRCQSWYAGFLPIQARLRNIVQTCRPVCDRTIQRAFTQSSLRPQPNWRDALRSRPLALGTRPRRSVALHITRKHARKTRARSPIRDYTEKSASRPLRPGGLCNCQFMAEQSLITTGSFATAGQQLAAIAALACSFGGRLAAGAAGALAIRPALAIVATRARAGSRLAASAVGALAIRPTLAFVATRARAGRFRTARATLALATCRALAVLATLASANFRMALAHIAGANRLASTVGNRLLCRDSRYNQRAQ